MHPGALHDDTHSGESVTPPMPSPGPRPQLQLYLPEGGCHPGGPYFNTGHPLPASNPMAYTSYHTQKSLDNSMNSYHNVTSPTAYDYGQSTSSACSTPSSLLPSPISASSNSNSQQDPWSDAYVASPGGEGQAHQLAPLPTHNGSSHFHSRHTGGLAHTFVPFASLPCRKI